MNETRDHLSDKQWKGELLLKSKEGRLTLEEEQVFTLRRIRLYVGYLLAIPAVIIPAWLLLATVALG